MMGNDVVKLAHHTLVRTENNGAQGAALLGGLLGEQSREQGVRFLLQQDLKTHIHGAGIFVKGLDGPFVLPDTHGSHGLHCLDHAVQVFGASNFPS
jgi:hypothetical protein